MDIGGLILGIIHKALKIIGPIIRSGGLLIKEQVFVIRYLQLAISQGGHRNRMYGLVFQNRDDESLTSCQ